MKRLQVVIKGNVDLHDSLQYSRVNGKIEWNGLNAVLAERHPSFVARVRHEACARWDRFGLEGTDVPAELAERKPALGSMNLDAQFRSQILRQPADVIVLSIQCEVTNELHRHRTDGYTFLAAGCESWDEDAKAWLERSFVPVRRNTPEESMANLATVVRALRAQSSATILVYNASPIMPGERMDSHRGFDDALSTRVSTYNLALAAASRALDFLVVDVDQVVARAGADGRKLDFFHYFADGYRLIASEVVRMMEDRGHFDP